MSEYEDTCPDCLREAEKEVQPMSHTPGPWEITVLPSGAYHLTNGASAAPSEKTANARLIAAAPELLATLKHLVHWHDQLGQDDLHRAQTTIAHAEGKEKR